MVADVTPVTVVVVVFVETADVVGHDGAVPRPPSVARQVLLLQIGVVVVLVVTALGLAALDARRDARESATARALAVARSVADSPAVLAALASADPSASLQPYAERVRRDAEVDFVTIMAPDRTRYTHPDPANIGRPFVGDLGDAPQGGVFTQEYTGTLGRSMRAVVPVLDPARSDDGRPAVVALVSVGITLRAIDRTVADDLPVIAGAAGLVLLTGLLGTWLVARRLRRQTHGLGERELTRMYEYYAAVLHAVREGLLLLDDAGRVQWVNDEARRLLDLPADVEGRPLDDLGVPPGLVAGARDAAASADDVYVAGDRVLVVSSSPARWRGRRVGAVVTLRDQTELRAVSGELDLVRGLTDSLRAQTHEAANRLHTVVTLVEMGRPEQAVAFATEELALSQQLTDDVLGAVGEPVVAALLLGKAAQARELGVDLQVLGRLPATGVAGRDLVTVLGNLIDNAFDAVAERPERRVRVELYDAAGPRIAVADSGPGWSEDEAVRALARGWSTKAEGRGVGLALVEQIARRAGGAVTLGRSDLGGAEVRVRLPAAREPR